MSEKLKHLEIAQGVINRMANNSFLLKGWCVTLVAGLVALATKDADRRFLIIAYYPVVTFWGLDAYYLRQERLFRALYDSVRTKAADTIDFDMGAEKNDHGVASWPVVACAPTLLIFYGAMIGTVVLLGAWTVGR